MAILDSEKVDFLWKKIIYGVTKTASALVKFGSNETIPSATPVMPSQVWKRGDEVTSTVPTITDDLIQVYTGAARIRMTNDPTAPVNQSWIAASSYGDTATRLKDFIPPTFGSGYAVKVWLGDPNVGPAARVFPDTTNEEWVYDYVAGVLNFVGTIPSGKTATIGSGTVSAAGNGVYIEVYQYVGGKGVVTDLPDFPTSLSQLDDVEITTAGVADGQVLTYENSVWTPKDPTSALAALTDVDMGTALADGQVLAYNSADQVWEPASPHPGAADGFHLILGDVAVDGDGSWTPGLVVLTNNTPVSEAIDLINESTYNQKTILDKLVPAQPPAFPNATTLTVANSVGATPLLASSVTDNSGTSSITAGSAVTRITAAGVSSNAFNDVGPGDSGVITVLVNGSSVGTHTMTGTSDNGTYNGLVISDQKDFPVSTPGFWKSFDLQLTLVAASQGVNKVQITDTAAGNTGQIYFVRDNVTAVPTVSGGSVTQATLGTVAYSSSVPHYNTGGQLNVNASISNLAGETYYGGADPFTISGTNSIIANKVKTYANLSITTPIAHQTTTATAISQQVVDIDGTNVHNSGIIQGLAKNVNGSSSTTNLSSTIILVKRGTAGSRIDENSVAVTGLGSSPNANAAVRVSTGSGDKPAAASTAWDSTAALASHEATCVGGVYKHDQTNYSTGYLPAGPDLSGKPSTQYFTEAFQRTPVSAFKINVTGTYAGMWVRLPGVSDAQPNGGGWWDMFQSYDGSGIPGESGDTVAGCALGSVATGGSGSFQCTFGTASSNSATGNQIEIRFRLNSGQSVTALSFSN